MRPYDRFATKLTSILSLAAALWGLASVASPLGAVGGAGAAVFGVVFGVFALRGQASGRWRKTALVGSRRVPSRWSSLSSSSSWSSSSRTLVARAAPGRATWLKGDALIVEQGIEMRRPSRIDVTVTTPDSVVVCGSASRLSGPCRSPNEVRGRGGLPDAIADLERALVGRELPDLTLASTVLPVYLRELGAERLVLFIYPHATGLAEPPVPGWDSIPGARGCTAQSCGFRDQHARFAELGAEVVGLSVQTTSEQQGFAERVGLRYRLISDPNLLLATTLGLPTFLVSGRRFYRRLTLVAEQGVIVKVFDPVAAPAENAAEVVRWLESREIQPGSPDGGS